MSLKEKLELRRNQKIITELTEIYNAPHFSTK